MEAVKNDVPRMEPLALAQLVVYSSRMVMTALSVLALVTHAYLRMDGGEGGVLRTPRILRRSRMGDEEVLRRRVFISFMNVFFFPFWTFHC